MVPMKKPFGLQKMFKNKENECITTTDGRQFFISRSVAVISTVICQLPDSNDIRVLVNQRSKECPDHAEKWNMPCGYLDWNESAGDAAIREVFEECGFDVRKAAQDSPRVLDRGILDNKPWRVITHPQGDDRQNVLFYYALRFVADELPEIGGGTHQHEVIDVQWMPIKQALATPMAFDHHLRLKNYIGHQLGGVFNV